MKVRHTTVVALESNLSGRRTIIRNEITSGLAQNRSIAAVQPMPTEVTRQRRKTKSRPKLSTIAIYASVFVLLVVMVAIGYQSPQPANGASNVASVTKVDNTSSDIAAKEVNAPSVDDVVATEIAAKVAMAANMSVAPYAKSMAVSTRLSNSIQTGDAGTISKSTIVESVGSGNYSSQIYVVQDGDTVDSVAAKFNISSNTLRWANNLTDNDQLKTGTSLVILPTNGILYTAKSGDTLASIADKYKSDATRIELYNSITGDPAEGQKLILPDGQLPEKERPGYVEVQQQLYIGGYGGGFGGQTWHIKTGTPMYAGNTYAVGNCTAYAYDRRKELGLPVSDQWGNAASWAWFAANAGLQVDHNPSAGAVIQNGGGFGHVGIVEEVMANGDISISEMNAYVSGGGWNQVSGRIIPASSVSQYLYIH